MGSMNIDDLAPGDLFAGRFDLEAELGEGTLREGLSRAWRG